MRVAQLRRALIMTEVHILISHFNIDLDDDVLVTISDTDYSND